MIETDLTQLAQDRRTPLARSKIPYCGDGDEDGSTPTCGDVFRDKVGACVVQSARSQFQFINHGVIGTTIHCLMHIFLIAVRLQLESSNRRFMEQINCANEECRAEVVWAKSSQVVFVFVCHHQIFSLHRVRIACVRLFSCNSNRLDIMRKIRNQYMPLSVNQ